jgi:hypothetical protein
MALSGADTWPAMALSGADTWPAMALSMPPPIACPIRKYDSALCHQWYPWLTGELAKSLQ